MGLRLSPARPKMVNPRDFPLGVVLLVLAASGCAGVPRATQNGVLKNFWAKISTEDLIRTRGVGVAPTKIAGMTLTARRGTSRIAALSAARYELLSVIKGVRLSGGVTISQLMEKDSLVRELADDVVFGGEEVLTEWTKDGGCVTTLELRRSTVERLIQQKSEREKGLEKRIADDIVEINRLNKKIVEVGLRRMKQFDEITDVIVVDIMLNDAKKAADEALAAGDLSGFVLSARGVSRAVDLILEQEDDGKRSKARKVGYEGSWQNK